MTWLENGLARDQRWSDDRIVEWTAEELDQSGEQSAQTERRVVDVFDALGEADPSESPRDVFAEWASSLGRAEFVDTGEMAPIELAEADDAAPLPGLLGGDDPMAALTLGPASFSDGAVVTDDITALTHIDDRLDTRPAETAEDDSQLTVDDFSIEEALTAEPAEPAEQIDEPIAQPDQFEPLEDLVQSAVADAFEPDTGPSIDDGLESADEILSFDDDSGEA